MAELIPEEEITEEFVKVMRTVSVGTAGFAATLAGLTGALVGFETARRRLEKKYAERAEQEIDEMRDHFRNQMIAREVKPDLDELGKKVTDLGYGSEAERDHIENAGERKDQAHARAVVEGPGEPNTPDVPPAIRNIFETQEAERAETQQDPDPVAWNYEAEKASREGKHAYVIHADEVGDAEFSFDEITLTYYQGDDVLCDSEDKVVDDQERVVGIDNLDRFGHGSNDPNIVFVRNEAMQLDIEIVRSEKTFAEEVHGLAHADAPPRKRRTEWDE